TALDLDPCVVRPVGAVPVDRQRRPGVLRLRLGDAAPRGWISRHLSRCGPDRAGLAADPSLPLAGISSRVWRGPDQAARRPVLAKPDVPLLPPRDPAHAQPAELVLSSLAETTAPHGGAGQFLCAAGGAVLLVHSVACDIDCGCADHPHPGVAGAERQFLVAELSDYDARDFRVGRSDPVAVPSRFGPDPLAAPSLVAGARGRRDPARAAPQLPTRAQPHLT